MKWFVLIFVLPQFVGLYIAFWLSDAMPEFQRNSVLLGLPCMLLVILLMLWVFRDSLSFAEVKRRMTMIQGGVCAGALLFLIGASEIINARAFGFSAPVFRSGFFEVVYFGAYVAFLLAYQRRLRKREINSQGH